MAVRYPFHTTDYQGGDVEVWGKPWFVDSGHTYKGDSTAQGTSKDIPFATLAYALTDARVQAMDTIYCAPRHAETISSATALRLNKAGIHIKGIGHGLYRPTFTLDTVTTATIPVSANNIRVENCVFSANFADIVAPFTIGAAKDFRIERCLFKATAVDMNFLHIIDTGTVDNSADGFSFVNNVWQEVDAATLAFMLLDSAIDRMEIIGNRLYTGAATVDIAALITGATGKNMTAVSILNNDMYITGNAATAVGLLITTDGTAGTGIIARNNLKHLDATTELLITATHHFGLFDNRASAVFNAQGYLLPAIDA